MNFTNQFIPRHAMQDERPPMNTRNLFAMLATVRPENSIGEQNFVQYIIRYASKCGYVHTQDMMGNVIINNLDTNGKSRVMFTAHTDTVHNQSSPTHKQVLGYHHNADGKRLLGLSNSERQPIGFKPNCLGADDATGCYIMLKLLRADVKGLYVFFRGEESGGKGSSYFRENADNASLLQSLTHCVSFDRKGYDSIITHQALGRCASDKFAEHLAQKILDADPTKTLKFKADDGGTFTDSANFTDIISECTNLSVGYFYQHTKDEVQDLDFAEKLANVLCNIDWTSLEHYREPKLDYAHRYDWYSGDMDIYDTVSTIMSDINRGGYEYAVELAYNDPEQMAEILYHLASEY